MKKTCLTPVFRGLRHADDRQVAAAAARFRLGVPTTSSDLSAILLAAWNANESPVEGLPQGLDEQTRTVFLNDLVLKSIEILDYEQTIAEARADRKGADSAER